jgi:hypothetical protein
MAVIHFEFGHEIRTLVGDFVVVGPGKESKV